MSVKLGSGHRRHLNICDQASGLVEMRRREEIGWRRERLGTVTPRPHKPSHGFAKEGIILDDRDQCWFGHAVSNNSLPAIHATLHSVARPWANSTTHPAPKDCYWAMPAPINFGLCLVFPVSTHETK